MLFVHISVSLQTVHMNVCNLYQLNRKKTAQYFFQKNRTEVPGKQEAGFLTASLERLV